MGIVLLYPQYSSDSSTSSPDTSIETVLNVAVNNEILSRGFIELPHDCDTSRAITLSLNGIAFPCGTFWEVINQNYPKPDLIAWSGLELQSLAQLDDFIIISYYRRSSLS